MALATQNDWVTVNPTNAREVNKMMIMMRDLCMDALQDKDKYKG
jgi:hypothetical protein